MTVSINARRRTLLRTATVGLAAIGLTVTGISGLASPVSAAAAAPVAAAAGPADAVTRTVTETDNQATVTLRTGDTLVVSLGADYVPPTVTGSQLTPLTATGGYPTRQPLLASFAAVGSGSLDVRSQTDYDCLHVPPLCPRAPSAWSVHVVVEPVNTTPPPGDPAVSLGPASSGTTAQLHVGDTVEVILPARFRPPTVHGKVLRRLDLAGGYPTGQDLVAHYVATAPGQATIFTTTDAACLHQTPPCALPIQLWTVRLEVSPRSIA